MNAGCWTANRRDNTMSFMAHDAGFDVVRVVMGVLDIVHYLVVH